MKIPFIFTNNLIIIKVLFTNKIGVKKLNLLLDTGSDTSIIFSTYDQTEYGFLEILNQSDETIYKFSYKFRIIKNTNTINYQSDSFSFDGVLGQDFLKESYCIDYIENIIILKKDNVFNNKIKLPSSFMEKFVILDSIISKNKFNLIFDTASSEELIIFERTLKKIKPLHDDFLKLKNKNIQTLFGAFNSQSVIDLNKKIKICIGKSQSYLNIKVLLDNEMTTKLPIQFEGILGNSIFINQKVCVNLNKKHVLLTATNKK